MNSREIYLNNVLNQAGKPYLWGAWGPDAFDCSGLVSFGLGFKEKKCAADLFLMFKTAQIPKAQALPGSIFFYGPSPAKIDHVMTVLQHWPNGTLTLIGARGGDSETTTLDIAAAKGAMVDVTVGTYWSSHFQYAVDPFQL